MEAHILLVEDDTTARMLLAEVLDEAGYQVTTAQDGESALEMLNQDTDYDVVITDIRMRDIDGIKVLEAARQCSPPPSVILLTGYGSLETAVAALRAGAQDYLLKPAAPHDLLAHVERAIEIHENEVRQNHAVRIIEQGLAQLQGQASTKKPSQTDSASPPPRTPGEPQKTEESSRYLRVGLLNIDNFRHTASFNGDPLHLTPIEYSLLSCLAESPGRVVSYREIVRCSHGHDVDEAEAQSLLKAHIRNMRRKIDPDYLVNVRGTGYMLVDPQKQDYEQT